MPAVKSNLKARDVMTSDPLCVSPATTIVELARIFEDNDISGAPVVDAQGRAVGIVSKTDLIRQCARGSGEIPPAYMFEMLFEIEGEDAASTAAIEDRVHVEDFMTEDPIVVGLETPAASVARLMNEQRVHRVIVTDKDDFVVGIITCLDLVGAFADQR